MDNSLNENDNQLVENELQMEESTGKGVSPISLDIDDTELVKIVNEWIDTSKEFYEEKYNLVERRKKNETYLFGRQLAVKEDKKLLKDYEARFGDNVLYEIESSLKPLAMSHLPDMIVLAGSDDPEKQKTAKNVSLAINDTNRKRKQRTSLALGFKHLPAYFTGVIKARWDSEIQDFRFDNVHPDLIIADHTSKSTNADDMRVIAESLPITVQELFMRYPSKKEKLTAELKADGVTLSDDPTWKELATEVQISEVWFDWYKKKETDEVLTGADKSIFEPGHKYEKVAGVLWKYGDVILEKMLDPNFDHEGEDIMYIEDPANPENKQEVKEENIMMLMLSGQLENVSTEKVYHNYFKLPRKPYFFFGYDQWGKIPYDETSRIEQNIRNQENLDEQGKRVIDKLKQRVKHLWSKDSGLQKADIQKMDMDNPNLDALVNGNLSQVHKSILPERPDASEFKSLQDGRDRMYAVAGANAIRGNLQSDVATTNQIAREADFTRADDLVEDTINAACEWMAEWQMQFIKLRYTEDHMRQIMGAKGAVTLVKLRRDTLDDGMEVTIKASSTDKLKAQRNAMEMAKIQFIDPLTFYEDMDMSDPKGRVERLMLFTTDPAGYIAKYVMELENAQQMAGALAAQPLPNGQPVEGGIPQSATPTDTTAVASEPPVGVPASPMM